MQKEELSELYILYGFTKEEETEGVLVFSYNLGYFHNIEIVKLKNNQKSTEEAAKFEQDYKAIEYQNIAVHTYKNIQEAHERLFSSFFRLQDSKKRLQMEYDHFCQRQDEKLLCNKYVYVPCRYKSENENVSGNLIQYITDSVNGSGAKLTILEAAAGYGKTCTVHEILHKVLEEKSEQIPLFIELSKNRAARIFRYVLQDEIDKKFTQLSSELVIREIKNGRLPLIIDGFDELIEQKVNEEDEIDESSLTMLSTIAELLGEDSNAWILLTTRNSAIFTGDIFEEWVLSKLGVKCDVERMQILMPAVKEWLGEEKCDAIQDSDVDIEKISNPVLLTFIRNLSIEELKKLLKDEDAILNKYFSLLLSRELERQSLELTEEELYTVVEKLAADFVRYDMTSETIDFIQELLNDIMADDLLKYRTRYKEKKGTDEGILSKEEFIKRMSHNSFLDRISMNSNQIGFINEFILGVLAGDAVRDGWLNTEEISERYIDISATAYSTRKESVRKTYYEKLRKKLADTTIMCRLNAEICLLHTINSNYNKGFIRNVYFKDSFSFDTTFKFEECTFDSCVFDNCVIYGEVFSDCKFFNCQFYDIKVKGTAEPNLLFMGCSGYKPLENVREEIEPIFESEKNYEKIVLEQFWKPGYQTAELRRAYTALFKGISNKENIYIQNAIKKLMKKGMLKELNVCYELNVSQMEDIKKILGR